MLVKELNTSSKAWIESAGETCLWKEFLARDSVVRGTNSWLWIFFFLSFVHYLSLDFGREKIKKEKRLFFFSQ